MHTQVDACGSPHCGHGPWARVGLREGNSAEAESEGGAVASQAWAGEECAQGPSKAAWKQWAGSGKEAETQRGRRQLAPGPEALGEKMEEEEERVPVSSRRPGMGLSLFLSLFFPF